MLIGSCTIKPADLSSVGKTFMDVLHRYAEGLLAVGSKRVIVSSNERIQEQLSVTRVTDLIGADNDFEGDERVGSTIKRRFRCHDVGR